jgi:ABC-2 type transport system ATP-binding protein
MIKVEGLTKKYGTLGAVRDVSFTIEAGEIVGFLGPNGAGKSTTMNIITGCLSATSGSVSVNGKDILADPLAAKREIGYLPEHPPVYGEMTVEEYLRFVWELKGCTLPREEHIREICDVVKITDVRGRLIRNLSKGYRQRVGIAQALVGNPPVLIFDEPTVGLDPKQIIEVRNLLRTLGKNHTVILSTHILPEVQAVCNRLLVINEGEIIADRPTEELTRVVRDANRYRLSVEGTQNAVIAAMRAVPGVLRVDVLPDRDGQAYQYRVESAAGTDVRRALSLALAEKSFPILAFEPISSNLEEVFLQLIEGGAAPTAKKSNRRAR